MAVGKLEDLICMDFYARCQSLPSQQPCFYTEVFLILEIFKVH